MESYEISYQACDKQYVIPLPLDLGNSLVNTLSQGNILPDLHECKFDRPTVLFFCILLVTCQAQARFFCRTLQDSCWGQVMVISAGKRCKSRNVFPLSFLDSLPSLVPYYLSNRNILYLMFYLISYILRLQHCNYRAFLIDCPFLQDSCMLYAAICSHQAIVVGFAPVLSVSPLYPNVYVNLGNVCLLEDIFPLCFAIAVIKRIRMYPSS